MPGLFGIFFDKCTNRQQVLQRFAAMQNALNFFDYPVEEFTGGCTAFGVIGPQPNKAYNFFYEGHAYVGLIDGCIDSCNGEDNDLHLGEIFKNIVRAYSKGDYSFLSSINGEFNIILFCPDRGKLLILTDRFAFKKIYMAKGEHTIYLFPDFAALTALPFLHGKLDSATVADHILFTHPLNNKTFRDDISLLPNASVIIFDKKLNVKIEKYWKPYIGTGPSDFEECADNAFHLLRQGVLRKIKKYRKINLSLSGGLDSRLLAAISSPYAELLLTSYGYKKSYDCTIAEQVANSLQAKWYHTEIDPNYVEQVEESALFLNDGMAPAEQFFHINAINKIMANSNTDHLPNLSGFYGDVLLGGSKNPKSLEKYSSICQNIAGWLKDNLSHHIDTQCNHDIFTNEFNAVLSQRKKEYAEELTATIDEYECDGRGDVQIDNIFVFYHARRYLSSLCQYTLYCRDLKPFLDYDFYDYYLTIPIEFRLNHRLYFRIINKFFPDMAKIPYASTGSRVGMPVSITFKKKKKLYNNINYKLSRLTKGKFLFNDPYNYVQMAKWNFFCADFVKKAKNILLEEQTLDRNILNPTGIERVYGDYKKGMWSGNILLNLYFLEKWFRLHLESKQ